MVRRFAGWIGIIVAAALGAALSFGALAFFAPVAPTLWLLIAGPLLLGIGLAAMLAGPLARWTLLPLRLRRWLAAVLAALPMVGLLVALFASPPLARASPPPDPRGPHRTLRTPTGAAIAWWSLAPSALRHATPVIFLHGGPGTFTRNRDFALGEGLRADGFRTIYYDQAGSGASANLPVAAYTLANAVADLDALRAALGAPRIVLFGQSWGTSLLAAYAHAHPDRVAGAIIDSPGDFPGHPLPLDYAKTDTDGGFKPTLRDAALYLLISYAPQLSERWASQDDARAIAQARGATTKAIYGYQCKGARTPLARPLSAGGSNLFAQLRLQDSLARQSEPTGVLSRAPALLVRTECDYLPPQTALLYLRAFPAATRIDVPGRGHAFFGHEAEQSERVGRWAAAALAKLP